SAPETGLAQVRVRTAGFVERVAVSQTGVAVKRGQPLAYVYSPEAYRAQEDYVAASRWSASAPAGGPLPNAELTAAARRSLELLGLGAADIDEITRTHQPIRALPIRAPAAGVVTRFNALLGSRADPEMVLYEIADLSKVWVIASVHERDVSSMRVGMEVRFTSANSTQEALTGKVDLIEPILEESTRTARVRIVLANADGNLRPGQFGEVEFELSGSLGLSVPRDAVIRTGEHEYVYLATGTDRFEPRLVRTGLSREGRVQVLSGLAEGDRVVTRGSFMLDSESRLKASLAASSSAAPPSKPAQSGQPAQPDQPAQPTPPSAPLPMPAGHSH
ncbi:MAG TPA: efflux RND transporter periplasmic adaptor subunit, partial [Polyangiaceae bacterium]|nr:efflux RND transporter periplasmic adaptor subunit [Polyangiaceae bacterium]